MDDNLILRELTIDDANQIAILANNKKIWENVRDIFPFPYTKQSAINFIQFASETKTQLTLVIELNGELAGIIGLIFQDDIYRKSAEIGYWIGEPYWNKGLASWAVNQLTEFAFSNLGLVRVFAGVFEYNDASKKVLEKCGFELEGIKRKALFKKGNIYDEFLYSKVVETKL